MLFKTASGFLLFGGDVGGRKGKTLHKAVFCKDGADIPADNLIFIDQKICADILLLTGVVKYRVGKPADLFSFEFAQVKALGGLNLVVILVDIPEGLRDHDLYHLDWFAGNLPSKTLQKLDAGRIVRCVGVVCLGNRRQGIRRRGFFFLDDSNEQNGCCKEQCNQKNPL